jgi:putative nucleotidyltransferase with HDIG domain
MEALLKTPRAGDPPIGQRLLGRVGLGGGPTARTLERLVLALESRAPGTYGHSQRVGLYADEVGRALGLSRVQRRRIRRAGTIHDVGKTKLPSEILNKPAALTGWERSLVGRHALIGAAMVAGLGDPELTAIVRHHHERFDGAGYPDGLAGEEIPLGARVIAVCDTFDALTTHRPYRRPIGHHAALDVLAGEAGTQFDPQLVEVFHSRFAPVWATAA